MNLESLRGLQSDSEDEVSRTLLEFNSQVQHCACVMIDRVSVPSRIAGADFTKGLKLSPFFWLSQGLKSKTLVLTRSGT